MQSSVGENVHVRLALDVVSSVARLSYNRDRCIAKHPGEPGTVCRAK